MDTDTVDRQYAALQQQSQQSAALFQTLAAKLSAAAEAGDQTAREWQLDLREIALAVRDEETATSALLQSIHSVLDSHLGDTDPLPPAGVPVEAPPPVDVSPPVDDAPPGAFPAPYEPHTSPGGTLGRMLASSFGQAIASGAGFSIGDDLVNSIFHRR